MQKYKINNNNLTFNCFKHSVIKYRAINTSRLLMSKQS